MISAIIIYNQKGEVLISRLYRDGLRRSIADVFRIQVISNPEVIHTNRLICLAHSNCIDSHDLLC